MHYKCYYYSGKIPKNTVDMWLSTNQVYMVHDNFNQMLNSHYQLIIFIFVIVEKFIKKLCSPNAVSSFMNLFTNANEVYEYMHLIQCVKVITLQKKNRTDKWYHLIVLIWQYSFEKTLSYIMQNTFTKCWHQT